MKSTLLLFLAILIAGCLPTGPGERTIKMTPVRVDRLTETHQPHQVGDKFIPVEGQPGELIWLTGAKIRCVSEGGALMSDRFLAYSTLDLRWGEWHNEKLATSQSARLFGLGRGLSEYHLPDGYGVPMHSNEPLWYSSRVINPDPYLPAQRLGQELTLSYLRERGLVEPMNPVLVRPVDARESGSHLWELPPGPKTVRTDISDLLYLPGKTRLVGVTVWMLDFAQQTTLRDTTTGQDLLVLKAALGDDGEVQSQESYSDPKGLELDPTHRYEIEASFNNTSRKTVQVGAYLNLYLEDSNFTKPPR
jgi:hypothetical protein